MPPSALEPASRLSPLLNIYAVSLTLFKAYSRLVLYLRDTHDPPSGSESRCY